MNIYIENENTNSVELRFKGRLSVLLVTDNDETSDEENGVIEEVVTVLMRHFNDKT